MTSSEELRLLLKHKGIGPEGSKSLTPAQLERLTPLLNDESISITTRATMLTAMIMLDPTDTEEEWIMSHQPFDEFLPKDLTHLFTHELSELSALNLEIIQHQDLNAEDATLGATLLLNPAVEAKEKAVFLEGQRLKRETFEENLSFFKVFAANSSSIALDLPEVILFGDSFDGCQRINPYTIFSCAVLASLDVPSYMTGVDSMAPKNGLTAHQILKESNKTLPESLEEAKREIEARGWTYVDLSIFFPAFYALKTLREEMVKRPMLATFEKMLTPLKGKQTHLVTAYTHKAYRSQVVQLNQAFSNVDSMINIKGMEATSRPHLERSSDLVKLQKDELVDTSFDPVSVPYESEKEETDLQKTIVNGETALSGKQNLAFAAITNQCVLVLTELLQWERSQAIQKVQHALESGAALVKWK